MYPQHPQALPSPSSSFYQFLVVVFGHLILWYKRSRRRGSCLLTDLALQVLRCLWYRSSNYCNGHLQQVSLVLKSSVLLRSPVLALSVCRLLCMHIGLDDNVVTYCIGSVVNALKVGACRWSSRLHKRNMERDV